jgi:hypothetical protein
MKAIIFITLLVAMTAAFDMKGFNPIKCIEDGVKIVKDV